MLQPKRTKFRKLHKGRIRGVAKGGSDLNFGTYGLKATTPERVTAKQIEAARREMTSHMKRQGRVWFRILPAQQKIITAIKNGETPDGDLVALAWLRSKHNTYMSLPLLWTMINEHTVVFSGKLFNCEGAVLLVVIALGWHIIFQCYKRSGKVQGF